MILFAIKLLIIVIAVLGMGGLIWLYDEIRRAPLMDDDEEIIKKDGQV